MYHVVEIDRRLYLQVDFAAGRELDRVVQNIEQNLPYPGDVADHGRCHSWVDPGAFVGVRPFLQRNRDRDPKQRNSERT